MHRRAFALGAAATLVLPDAASAWVRRPWSVLNEFTVDLPAGFLMLPDPQGIDAQGVQILKGKRAYVWVWIGMNIAFPAGLAESDPTILVETHTSNPMQTASVITRGRRRIAEYLWETPIPQFPHAVNRMLVMAYLLSPKEQPIADRIAASVRPKPPANR